MLYKLFSNFRMFLIYTMAILVVMILVATLLAPSAYAASCGGTETVLISCNGNENGIWAVLLIVLQVMTAGVGILAVGGIVYASVLWTTAEDKPEQIAKAKQIIINVVIGIIAFALMYAGLQFVIPGGVFNRAFGFSTVKNSTDQLPDVEDGAPSGAGSKSGSGASSTSNKKATIRIGAYNAWSVTKTDSSDQVRRLGVGMAKMRQLGAEVVALQEFSPSQTSQLKGSSYWNVYRSNMVGNRGLGVAYKRDAFKVLSSSDLTIPRAGADQREPIVTLERKKDKARITVMSVHLVAMTYGKENYDTYQPLQQKAVKNKVLQLEKSNKTVIVAGDFNWDFSAKKGYMDPLKYRGIRYTNFFVPADQKISNFQNVDAGEASDHQLIVIDAETKSFGK